MEFYEDYYTRNPKAAISDGFADGVTGDEDIDAVEGALASGSSLEEALADWETKEEASRTPEESLAAGQGGSEGVESEFEDDYTSS